MNNLDLDFWDSAYATYKAYAEKLEEPDYDFHIDDPTQNCVRIMTQEEYIEYVRKNTKNLINL